MHSHLKRKLLMKLHVFCGHCTLHGVYYLQKRWGIAGSWGMIVIAGFVMWGVLGHMIWQTYNSDPTVTVVESTHYRTEQIPFPGLIICDPLPVYGSKTKSVTHILYSRGYTAAQIDEYYDSFANIFDSNYLPSPYIRKMHAILQDLGFTLEVLVEMFKKPCDVTLVKCRWRSMEYNCSDMFVEVVTVVGHCCQFEIAHFKRFAPINTTFVPGNANSEGLDVTLNGVKEYHNGTVHDGSVMMYIFDATNKLTRLDSSVSLAASTSFEVEIEIFAIDSSPEVKALPLKTRKCTLSTDQGIGASFYQKCISTLIVRKVVNQCRCLPFMYSAEDLSVEDYPICTWERYLCIYPQMENTFAVMHSLIQMNDCYQSCDYVEYDPKVDFVRTLRIAMNYTKLSVRYASRTCMKYRREVIYTWDQMLANLGGIFSLCLGGSFISIIEIVWFLIELLVITINSYKRKPKRAENKIIHVKVKDMKKQEKYESGYYKFTN